MCEAKVYYGMGTGSLDWHELLTFDSRIYLRVDAHVRPSILMCYPFIVWSVGNTPLSPRPLLESELGPLRSSTSVAPPAVVVTVCIADHSFVVGVAALDEAPFW